MKGYDEQTYSHPQTGHAVYGQDGYSWYCTKVTVARHFAGAAITPNRNPLFVTLNGMTARKLVSKGFYQ